MVQIVLENISSFPRKVLDKHLSLF